MFQVFDENRFTRDDFLGLVELTLINLPKEQEGRVIAPKSYQLRPRRSVGYVNDRVQRSNEPPLILTIFAQRFCKVEKQVSSFFVFCFSKLRND